MGKCIDASGARLQAGRRGLGRRVREPPPHCTPSPPPHPLTPLTPTPSPPHPTPSPPSLETRLAAEAAAFAALDPAAAATQMPRLQAPMLSVDNMEPAQVGG